MTHIAGGASGVVAVVGPDCSGNEAVKDCIEIKEKEGLWKGSSCVVLDWVVLCWIGLLGCRGGRVVLS